MRHLYVTPERMPALGDVRACDTAWRIWISPRMRDLKDWPRYVEAISAALSRGVSIRWTTEG